MFYLINQKKKQTNFNLKNLFIYKTFPNNANTSHFNLVIDQRKTGGFTIHVNNLSQIDLLEQYHVIISRVQRVRIQACDVTEYTDVRVRKR